MPDIDEVIRMVQSNGHMIEERNGIPMFIHPDLTAKEMETMLHDLGWNRSWGYVGPAKEEKRSKKGGR